MFNQVHKTLFPFIIFLYLEVLLDSLNQIFMFLIFQFSSLIIFKYLVLVSFVLWLFYSWRSRGCTPPVCVFQWESESFFHVFLITYVELVLSRAFWGHCMQCSAREPRCVVPVQYQFCVYFLAWGFLPHKLKHCPYTWSGILFLRGIPRKSFPPVFCATGWFSPNFFFLRTYSPHSHRHLALCQSQLWLWLYLLLV